MNKLQSWLSGHIQKFAVENWECYAIKREWLAVILLLLITKLATSGISVFSGYQYLDNFFFGLLNMAQTASAFAVISLLLIECLTALFLAKFFKFALRMKWKVALMPLFFAILLFAVSFVTSTNGIAIYTTKGVDLSNEINGKYNTAIENLKKDYAGECATVQDHIASIKNNPEEWKDGKRSVLSAAQNIQLNLCYDKLSELKKTLSADIKILEEKQTKELSENAEHTTNEADKYYNIVAVIMIIQVICSGALWFFWCKISGEDAPDIDARDGVKDIYDKAANLIKSGVSTCIDTEFSTITTAFATLDNELHRRQLAQAERWKQQQQEAYKIAAEANNIASDADTTTIDGAVETDTTATPDTPAEAPAVENKPPQIFKIRGFEVPDTAPKTAPETAPKTAPKTGDDEQPHSTTYGPVVTPDNTAVKITRVCPVCGSEFLPRAWNQKFCCKAHKDAYWQQQGLDLDTIRKANAKR